MNRGFVNAFVVIILGVLAGGAMYWFLSEPKVEELPYVRFGVPPRYLSDQDLSKASSVPQPIMNKAWKKEEPYIPETFPIGRGQIHSSHASGAAPLTVAFTLSPIVAEQMLFEKLGNIHDVTIEYGDGENVVICSPRTGAPQPRVPCESNWIGQHTYMNPGTYVVRVGGTCNLRNCEIMTWTASTTVKVVAP